MGLDFSPRYIHAPGDKDGQREVLREQIRLGAKFALPLHASGLTGGTLGRRGRRNAGSATPGRPASPRSSCSGSAGPAKSSFMPLTGVQSKSQVPAAT